MRFAATLEGSWSASPERRRADVPSFSIAGPEGAGRRAGIGRAAILSLLRAYKRFLSPLLPPACRFSPTCAEYAAEAVAKYGPARGLVLAGRRLLRCHPFHRGGFDPVP